jgi:kinesin family member 5
MGKLDDADLQGLIPRLMSDLFSGLTAAAAQGGGQWSVQCSMVEIYMERVRDLLASEEATAAASGDHNPLDLKIRDGKSGVWLENVTTVAISTVAEAMAVMAEGVDNRAVGATRMNAESSRSHSVFMVVVTQTSATGSRKTSKLMLVDLGMCIAALCSATVCIGSC